MSQNLFAGRIEDIQLEDEIQSSYLDYAMSVIVGRALPDVRDGLKPVHKRILWAMLEAGYRPDRPHRKSAAVIGDVLKKYHPHGDQSVYDALVRMAQDWSLRYPLVDGHGNFGSVDGDPAAAYRYTEARLAPMAMEMLRDIEAETVDFVPELRRVRAAARRPAQPVPEPAGQRLRRHRGRHGHEHPAAQPGRDDRRGRALPGQPRVHAGRPDEVRQGARLPDRRHDHGPPGHQGRLRDRPRLDQGPRGHRRWRRARTAEHEIVVTELPYQVNKARLAEKIAELVKLGKIKDIADLKDESNREGMRLVIECKRGANPQVVLNQLYKHDAAAGDRSAPSCSRSSTACRAR